MGETQYKYQAFISYRHVERDTRIARQVQQAIETFRLPKNVLLSEGAVVATGDARKLGRVFRDEDELPAADSLPARIREALDDSRHLIVICSPDSRRSDWVNREVATFVEKRGRGNVICVLVEGQLEDALPIVLSDSAEHPLAADLRPGTGKREQDETLRVIAALLGCGFDDLKQRERARKRKRMATVIAAVVVAALAVGVIAYGQHQRLQAQRQQTQISQSENLAAQSRELLAQGDRYGAMEVALAALPASESDTSTVLVPEAQEALEAALQVHETDTSWRPAYTIDLPNPVERLDESLVNREDADANSIGWGAVAVSQSAGYLAISDNAGVVTTYDIATGRVLASFELPGGESLADDWGCYYRLMTTHNEYLIISNLSGTQMLACYNGLTGERMWYYSGANPATLNTAQSSPYLMVSVFTRSEFQVAALDIETGELVAESIFDDIPLPLDAITFAATCGQRLGDYYLVMGSKLICVILDEDRVYTADLAYPDVCDIGYYNGTVVVTTMERLEEDTDNYAYAVQAFDEELHPLWTHEGQSATEMMWERGEWVTLISGFPMLGGPTLDDTAVAVRVGREIRVLDLATGETVFQRGFGHSLVDATTYIYSDGDYYFIQLECCDGLAVTRDVLGINDVGGDATGFQFPCNIRWAQTYYEEDCSYLVALSAERPDRVVVYRYPHDGQVDREYQLDELLALAHDQLAAAGRE